MIWYTRLTRELLSQKEFNHLRWSNSERSLCCLGINLNYLYSFLTSYRFVRCGETLFGKSSLELITHQHFFSPSPKNLDHTGISPKIGTLNSKCCKFEDIQCIPGWIHISMMFMMWLSPLECELYRPKGDQKPKCVFHGPRHGDVENLHSMPSITQTILMYTQMWPPTVADFFLSGQFL